MDKLATLTPTDIEHGVLHRMLVEAGIPNIDEYIKQFHQRTEQLIVDEIKHPTTNTTIHDEQIVPPADLQNWLVGMHPRFDHVAQLPVPEQHQPQQPKSSVPAEPPSVFSAFRLRPEKPAEVVVVPEKPTSPVSISTWLSGLHPRFDDSTATPPAQSPTPASVPEQQLPPNDLSSWMRRMAPNNADSTSTNPTVEPTMDTSSITPRDGNLGSWLTDWSKSLTEQPPPTSLDTWLQGLVSPNLHEPIGKNTTGKTRLNSYLNAAQKVLSDHGYNVANEIKPAAAAPVDTSMFGNVKQMYFLWKVLDKNNDRKITVEDVQLMLQEMGLGFLSKYLAQTLFDMVDSNHDGTLQFRDFVAFMGILKQLIGAVGAAKA